MTGMIHDKGKVLDRMGESEDNELRKVQTIGKIVPDKVENREI